MFFSMSSSTNKPHLHYTDYINPTMDQSSSIKDNPLVLMAEVCNNIGKDFPSKQRKKSLKRPCPNDSISPPMKKLSINPPLSIFYPFNYSPWIFPPSPFFGPLSFQATFSDIMKVKHFFPIVE